MATGDGGIAHVFLVPSSLTTTLDGGNSVMISTNTTYPFSHTITYNISATSPFDFYVRIPTWAGTNSTIKNTSNSSAVQVSPSSQGLQKIEVPNGEGTTVTLELESSPRVVTRANNTAAIYYGPLLYALAIEYESTSTAPINYYSEAVLPANTTDSHTHDFSITPTTPWNIAIDPSQIKVVQTNTTTSSGLPNPIWDLGAPPVELRVAAVEIDWPVAFDSAADPPENPSPTGQPFSARFVPYGSAKLHMAHLPVVQLSAVNL